MFRVSRVFFSPSTARPTAGCDDYDESSVFKLGKNYDFFLSYLSDMLCAVCCRSWAAKASVGFDEKSLKVSLNFSHPYTRYIRADWADWLCHNHCQHQHKSFSSRNDFQLTYGSHLGIWRVWLWYDDSWLKLTKKKSKWLDTLSGFCRIIETYVIHRLSTHTNFILSSLSLKISQRWAAQKGDEENSLFRIWNFWLSIFVRIDTKCAINIDFSFIHFSPPPPPLFCPFSALLRLKCDTKRSRKEASKEEKKTKKILWFHSSSCTKVRQPARRDGEFSMRRIHKHVACGFNMTFTPKKSSSDSRCVVNVVDFFGSFFFCFFLTFCWNLSQRFLVCLI